MKDTNYTRYYRKKNESNLDDYSWKTDPNYLRQPDSDKIYDDIETTNWNHESDYHNSYRVNGKYVKGRAIILSKKK